MTKTPRDEFAVEKIQFLLDLPPGEHSMTFGARGGRKIRLHRSPETKLTLTVDGAWNEEEKARIADLLTEKSKSRPNVCHLRDAEDPCSGLVFPDGNQFSASAAVYHIAHEVLGVNPARLPVEKSYDDHDARPEIARRIRKEGKAEILHEETGVRVWASSFGGDHYSLSVPVACLGSRGRRERAERFISNAGWSAYDADLGPIPDVGEDAKIWAYSRDQGGAAEGANQGLRLLCKIAELPINVRVSVGTPPPIDTIPEAPDIPDDPDEPDNPATPEDPTMPDNPTTPKDSTMPKDSVPPKPETDPDAPMSSEGWSPIGCALPFGVLVIILDFFDVGIFDGRGPGTAVIMFGLSILVLVLDGLKTGGLPILGGFIVREVLAPIFWISIAIYALAALTMLVIGCMMVFGVIES